MAEVVQMPSGSDFSRWPIETVAVLIAHPNELPISANATDCLSLTNSTYFGDVVQLQEADLLRLPNIDKDTLDELSHFMQSFDLRLGMELPGWSKIRADYVRNLFDTHLPDNVAFNGLIKKFLKAEALTEAEASETEPPPTDETVAVVVPEGIVEEEKIPSGEPDFTSWPLETLALLVAFPNELPLSVRATNCLYSTDYKFFGEVVLNKEADLYRIPNLGQKSGKEISDLIHEFGLHFEMNIPGWSREKGVEVRQFIASHLPPNVALTNLIRKGAASETNFISTIPIKIVTPVVEEEAQHFWNWPIEQRALLVATPVELPLPLRITNALSLEGYVYFGDVVQLSMHAVVSQR